MCSDGLTPCPPRRTSSARLLLLRVPGHGRRGAARRPDGPGGGFLQAGDRLAAKPDLGFTGRAEAGRVSFTLNDGVTYQRIEWVRRLDPRVGLICLNSLPPEKQEAVLRSLFDARQGAGFSALKTVIGATDFMAAGPFYTYDDTPGDVAMKHFSIARDLGPNGEITFIKRARQYGSFLLQAPMDYPPDWMLTDPADREHQDVNPKYYDALAHYYLRYLEDYAQHGVVLDYLSLFNEPGVYTKIPYDEIRELLKNHVGPLLVKAGVEDQDTVERSAHTRERQRELPHRAG